MTRKSRQWVYIITSLLIQIRSVTDRNNLVISECLYILCIFIMHNKMVIFLNNMPFLFNVNHILELEGTLTVIWDNPSEHY